MLRWPGAPLAMGRQQPCDRTGTTETVLRTGNDRNRAVHRGDRLPPTNLPPVFVVAFSCPESKTGLNSFEM